MTTIYDIAKAAGVTATTVSNVLSGKGSVSAATRARVLQYVRELDYQPNLIARSLIKGRSGMIGLVMPGIDNPFYSETATEVERLAYAANLRVFITALSRNDQKGQKMLGDLVSRRVDGFLITSGGCSLQTIHSVTFPRLPIVYCFWEKYELPEDVTAVALDLAQGGRLAAEHLLEQGHRRMGIITDISADGTDAHHPRTRGFQQALAQRGLSFDPQLLQGGKSTMEGGKAAALQLLTLPNRPTALFVTNDNMAIGALAAAWELGLQVPHDLSLVGHDNIAQAAYLVPPLTTIAIDRVTLLSHAMQLLLKAIEGQEVISPPTFPVSLLIRGSTGPCPE